MSTPRIPLPEGHEGLIARMQAAGYKSNPQGVCCGIAHMGMQAILAGDIKSFDERLKIIFDMPVDDFHKKINVNINAFFDGIELYQQPYLYPDLFEENKKPTSQNAILTAPLTQSVDLESKEKGGIAKICSFSGIYNQAELTAYFDSLRKILENNPDITHPLAFVLSAPTHAITVGYHPAQKQWFFIDAEHLPTIQTTNVETIAEYVIEAFSLNEVAVFYSTIYTSQQHLEALNRVIKTWQAQETWKEMHAVSTTKVQLKDSSEGSWIYVAAENNLFDEVHALLADPKTDPNDGLFDGSTPLYVAVQNNHLEVVDVLLKDSRTNPNKAFLNGTTPLYIAAQKGLLHMIVRLLKDSRTDPNQERLLGFTPLLVAEIEGNLDIVKALLADTRIDPNNATNEGLTPLYHAVGKNKLDLVEALLQHPKINPDPFYNGGTPLFLAAQNGQLNIVKLLLDKKADPTIPYVTSIESLQKFAKENHVEQKIETLIDEKVKKNPSSNISIRPIEIAQVMGHAEVVDLLKIALQTSSVKEHGFFASESSPSSSLVEAENVTKSSFEKK